LAAPPRRLNQIGEKVLNKKLAESDRVLELFTANETPEKARVTQITMLPLAEPKSADPAFLIIVKRWFLVGLVACASPPSRPATPHTPPPPPVTPHEPPPVADVPVASVKVPATRRAIEAPHGGPITVLAVTEDGKAALTADDLGSVRLWPALDGSREPRVVDVARPKQLAIGATSGGFTIGVLDEVGGVIVAQLDGDGVVKTRATLPADPAFAGVAMTARGALAWRSDHVLMIVAPDGTIAGKLAAEPGQRVTGLAVDGGRAVVAIDSAAKTRLRWLTVAPKLAWGGWITTSQDIGPILALSPGGTRFATQVAIKDRAPKGVVVDIGTGQVVADLLRDAFGFAFVDDDHLAVASANGINWVDVRTHGEAPVAGQIGNGSKMLIAASGGRAVSTFDAELVIATPDKIQYLGYELQSPSVAAAAGSGRLLIGVNDTFAMLDKDLRAIETPKLVGSAGAAVAEVRWLGGDAWLVESSNTMDGKTSLAIVDSAHDSSSQVRSGMTLVHLLMHEPSTQLVTLSLGDAPEVDHYDAARKALDRVAVMPKAKVYEQTELVPVSPQLADGAQLIAIHMRDQLRVQWLRDPKQIASGAGAITVCCSLAAVDAAGDVFVWQTAANAALELAIYRDGKRVGKLPTEGPTAVWPEPNGARILEVNQRSVSLYTRDGAKKWTQPIVGATEALWLDDGAIAVVTRSGLARIDAATGSLTAARCGWRFGLSPRPHPRASREQPVCIE
jgi:hypothetical protein